MLWNAPTLTELAVSSAARAVVSYAGRASTRGVVERSVEALPEDLVLAVFEHILADGTLNEASLAVFTRLRPSLPLLDARLAALNLRDPPARLTVEPHHRLWYCSERCKARDAAAHAEECALERAEALPAKSWAPRLLLRALAAPGDRGLLLALQSKPLTGEQRAWWGAIREALGDPPAYERLVGALANNCITVLLDAGPDDAVEEVAVGLYAAPSLMNHACAPSCAWRFGAGGALAAVASRPVAPGEPLTAPYDHPLTLMASREHRRKRLSSRFGFACACAACDAPEQGRDTPPSPAARQAASVLAGPGSLAAADARAAWDAFVDAGAPAALRAAAAWDAVEALASAEAGGARLAERERRAGADAADALLRDVEGRHLASHAELRRAAALRARWGGAG